MSLTKEEIIAKRNAALAAAESLEAKVEWGRTEDDVNAIKNAINDLAFAALESC
jgi:hypothetical protein